jgi:DNA-binding transcriptional LysR family regulator
MSSALDGTLDVGRLRLLREVALRGTIAGAARAVGLTPSAVSQQLAVLEREAGTQLLDRSPRGVALTGAGHALADRAAAILELLASARTDLDRMGGTVSGPVRIAAVTSAATIVSPAIEDLGDSIDVSVITAEPVHSRELLLAGDVDLAVLDEYDYVPLALPDSLIARELCAEELVVVAPRGKLGRRGVVPLTALRGWRWVMPPDDAACGIAVRSACRTAGFEPRIRWVTDDLLLLARAVAAGHGVAVLPRRAVAADVADVDVRRLNEPVLRRRLFAVVRSSAAARQVLQNVLAALDGAVRRAGSNGRG